MGNNVEAVGAEVDISGGTVGNDFDAFFGSTVNISGGTVGDAFDALSGSTVNISGGSVGKTFSALAGSAVNISGGSVGEWFDALDGSTVNIEGGTVGSLFSAGDGSTVNISGGAFSDRFVMYSNATVDISGVDFAINGVPLAGLDNIGDRVGVDLADGQVLSGTFANGTPFAFAPRDIDDIANGTLTLVQTVDPAIGPAVINVPSDPVPSGVRTARR